MAETIKGDDMNRNLGRPKGSFVFTKIVTLNLYDDDFQKITRLANARRTTLSETMRFLIRVYNFPNESKKSGVPQ